MKKTLLALLTLVVIITAGFAQTPQYLPYQAVARNAAGNLLQNQAISLRFTLHETTSTGTTLYQEKQSATTNNLGLFNVNLGAGTVVAGTFSSIPWGNGNPKFIQVEIDPTGGTNYTDLGASQMMSVPYALYAGNASALNGNAVSTTTPATNDVLQWNGSSWAPSTVIGPSGATGVRGVTGSTGATGANGSNGTDGATGPQGVQGITGNDGATGSQGIQGVTGAQGIQGVTGSAGAQGAQGIQGITGSQGVQGATGADGATGAQGLTGATGLLSAGAAAGNTPYWNGSSWVVNSSNIYNNGGNVGIGTANPTTALQVNGTTSTTNLKMTSGAAAGDILQSDASGNATWVAPTSANTISSVSNTSSANNLSTTVNGITGSTVPIVNSISNTSSVNNLSTTVNGVTSTAVPMVNSNSDTWTQSGGLSTTVNGVAASVTPATGTVTQVLGYNSSGAPVYQSVSGVLNTSVSNTSSANTLSTTVDGVTGSTVPIVNSISNTSSANNLSTTVNGVTSTAVPMVNSVSNTSSGNNLSTTVNGVAGNTVPVINSASNAWTQAAGLSTTVNGVTGTAISPASGTVTNILGYSSTGAPVYETVANVLATGSGNYIQNGTTQQASSNFNISGTGTIPTLYINNSSTTLTQGDGGVSLRTTTPYGSVDIGMQNASYAHYYTSAPASIFNTSVYTSGGAFSSYNGDLQLQTAGVTNVYLQHSTGNVGIGTSSPASALQVNGTTTTTNFQMTNGGTAGDILQSDASGNASWVSPNSLSGNGNYIQNGTTQQASSNFNISGNGTIGGALTIGNEGNIQLTTNPGSDASQGLTGIGFNSRATGGGNTEYYIYTAPVGGGYGVPANSLSFWEYPASGLPATNFPRVIIEPAATTSSGTALQIDGNGGISSGTSYFLNASSTPGTSYVNNGGGSFGVGTSTPSSTLQVNGKTTTTNLEMTNGAAAGDILQSDASGNASWVSPSASVVVAGNGLSYSGTTLNSDWTTSGTNIYNNNSGNVGLGTTTPSAELDIHGSQLIYDGNVSTRPAVNGGTLSTGELRGYGDAGNPNGDDGFLRISAGGGSTAGQKTYIDLTGYNASNTDMQNNVVFGVAGSEKMRLNATGFGIGTSSPSNSLTINGSGTTANTANTYQIGLQTAGTTNLTLGANSGASYIQSWGGPLIFQDQGNAVEFLGNIASTSTTTGAVQVTGGVGVSGSVNVGNYLTVQGSGAYLTGGVSLGSYYGNTPPTGGLIASGDVGIGTNSPTAPLQVVGESKLSTVSQGSDATERYYPNVISQADNSSVTGAWIIQTPIPRGSNIMFTLHVHGYGYAGSFSGDVIDFTVSGYAYNGNNGNIDGNAGAVVNYKLSDNGTDGINKYIGVDAAGNVGVVFGTTSLNSYYVRLAADAWITLTSTDYSSGWSIAQSTTSNFGFLDLHGPLANGNAEATSSGSYIQNTTTQQASSNFNISGNGTIGNTLSVGNSAGNPGTTQLAYGGGGSVSSRLSYGTDGTGWKFAIAKNQAGTVTDQMTITDAGNVGIGLTNPISSLQTKGTLTVGTGADYSGTNAAGAVGAVQITTDGASPVANRLTWGSGSGGWNFAISNNASGTVSDIMTFQPNGYVGIGATSPQNTLDVRGNMALGTYGGVNTAPTGGLIVPGKVGFGTATPAYLLDISAQSNTEANLGLTSGTASVNSSNPQVIQLSDWYSGAEYTSELAFDFYGSYYPANGSCRGIGLNFKSGRSGYDNIWFRDASSNIMGGFVNTSAYNTPTTLATTDNFIVGGNVGIGTPSPSTILDVSMTGGMIRAGGGSGNNIMQVYTGNTVSAMGMWAGGSSRLYSSGMMTFSVNATTGTSAPTGYTDAMNILASGKVGVATATPKSQFDVNGSVSIGSYGGSYAAPTNGLVVSGSVGIGTYTPGGAFDNEGGASVQQGMSTYVVYLNNSSSSSASTYNIAREWIDQANWGWGGIEVEEFGYATTLASQDYSMYWANFGYTGNSTNTSITTKISSSSNPTPFWTSETNVSGTIYWRDLQITVPAYQNIAVRMTTPVQVTTNLSNTTADEIYFGIH